MQAPKTAWISLRNKMLTGLVVIAPFGITLFVLYSIVRWFVTVLTALTSRINLFPGLHPVWVFLLNLAVGLALLVLILLLSGELVATFSGQRFVDFWEGLIERIPFGGTLYRAIKQVMSPGSRPFKKVVMIEFPMPGIYAIGFITGQPGDAFTALPPDEYVNVFIPNAITPTGGWLVVVKKSRIKELDMTTDEAHTLIISGGMASTPSTAELRDPNFKPPAA